MNIIKVGKEEFLDSKHVENILKLLLNGISGKTWKGKEALLTSFSSSNLKL